MKRVLFVLFFLGLVGYTAFQNQPQAKTVMSEQKPAVGYLAPYFSLQGLDNQTYQLNGPRQKPLVINFWASWCGPCRLEAPDLSRLYTKYQTQLDMYAVNVTSSDGLDGAKAFVESFKLPFPIPLDVKGEVADSYRVNAFPTTYLIDKNGVIRQKIVGMIEPKQFEMELKKLFAPQK